MSERPYELTSVFGVGFRIADQIARRLGVTSTAPTAGARADPPRAVARPSAAAARACRIDAARRRDGRAARPGRVDEPAIGESPIDELVEAGDLVREEQWIYRTETAELEAELAERVRELIDGPAGDRLSDPGGDDDDSTEDHAHRRAADRRPERRSPTACR